MSGSREGKNGAGGKPVVGITGPVRGGGAAWFFTAISVRLAGGVPKRIHPEKPASMEELDGLILGGGADVEPEKYGEELLERAELVKNTRTVLEWIFSILLFPLYWLIRFFSQAKTAQIDIGRDKLELQLLEDALAAGKPVLGICRGMQLLNVHFGGTLYQDISGYYTETPQVATIFPKKRVLIKAGSRLCDILRTDICNVNAFHNQAIKHPGTGIRLAAREKNTKIIQAIEHEGFPFVIGVQWHPEYLIQIERQRNIFRELIRVARAARAAGEPNP